MVRIINCSEFILSPSLQQVIRNGAANMGLDEVNVDCVEADAAHFLVLDKEGVFAFSVDARNESIIHP